MLRRWPAPPSPPSLPSSGASWRTHLEVGQKVGEILLPTSGLVQGAQF